MLNGISSFHLRLTAVCLVLIAGLVILTLSQKQIRVVRPHAAISQPSAIKTWRVGGSSPTISRPEHLAALRGTLARPRPSTAAKKGLATRAKFSVTTGKVGTPRPRAAVRISSMRTPTLKPSVAASSETFQPIRPGLQVHLVKPPGRKLIFINPDFHTGTAGDITTMVASRHGQAFYSAAMALPAGHAKYPINIRATSLVLPGGEKAKLTATEAFKKKLFYQMRSDTDIQEADAFICTFPSASCESLFAFNKSVIFAPSLRFSFRRCSRQAWTNSVGVLQKVARSRSPRHFLAALSRYDQEYVKYFTGLDALPLYSSSAGYVEQGPYRPNRSEILIGPLSLRFIDVSARNSDAVFASELVNRTEFQFATAGDLYGQFTFAQVLQHRAAVILPYAVMSMGLTELYAMGIPLFVPSAKLMKERPLLYPNDRTMTGVDKTYKYCGDDQTIVPQQHPASNHSYSPESLEPAAKFYWLQFADFHQWPHVVFFDSILDLISKLETTDLPAVHARMVAEWRRREARLDKVWMQIAAGLDDTPRKVPDRYYPMEHFLPA